MKKKYTIVQKKKSSNQDILTAEKIKEYILEIFGNIEDQRDSYRETVLYTSATGMAYLQRALQSEIQRQLGNGEEIQNRG